MREGKHNRAEHRVLKGPSLAVGCSGGNTPAWQRAAWLLGLNQPLRHGSGHVIVGKSIPFPSLSFPPCKTGL